MTDKKNQPAEKTRLSWSWLRMALSLREKIKLGDKQVIFIWAVVVGALGALMALVFEMGVELVQDVLTGRTSYRQIQVFQEMASQDPAWCIFVPAAGPLPLRCPLKRARRRQQDIQGFRCLPHSFRRTAELRRLPPYPK